MDAISHNNLCFPEVDTSIAGDQTEPKGEVISVAAKPNGRVDRCYVSVGDVVPGDLFEARTTIA